MAAFRVPVKCCSSTRRHLTQSPSMWRSPSPHRVNVLTTCEMGTFQQSLHNSAVSNQSQKDDEESKPKTRSTLETLKMQLTSVQKVRDGIVHVASNVAAIPRGFTSDFQKYIPFNREKDSSMDVESSVTVRAAHRQNISKDSKDIEREQHSFEKAMMDTNESISSFYHDSDTHTYMQLSAPVSIPVEKNKNIESEQSFFRNVWAMTSSKPGTKAKSATKVKKPFIQKDFISREAIDSRTRGLVHNIKTAKSNMSKVTRTEELCKHILQHPGSRTVACKENILPYLLKFRKSSDKALHGQANEALAMIGYIPPLKGRGIRILSIDGGGTRGLVAIEALRQLQDLTKQNINDMFDFVCGVSTGSLIAALVFLFRVPLDEAEYLYKEFSKQMFSRNRIVGTVKLGLSHAYYDSIIWENILKEQIGSKRMIEFSRDSRCPKFSGVSCVMNLPMMKNFTHRNYNLPPGVYSQNPGSCKHKIWEVIRASSAAPGYFEEFTIGDYVHQDGGLLTNNPTAIAYHEARLLWPSEDVQCVISLGTGRYEPTCEFASTKLSLKDKLSKIVDSATDTEAVHVICQDMLPSGSYFRFNPYMSEPYLLDEIRPEKLGQLEQDTKMYLRKNKIKMSKAVDQLLQGRSAVQYPRDLLRKGKENVTEMMFR